MVEKTNYYAVDRVEGAVAVLQDDEGVCIDVPLTDLPCPLSQGDVLTKQGDSFVQDEEEKQRRRERIYKLEQMLKKDS